MSAQRQRPSNGRPREPRAQLALVARYRSPADVDYREERTYDVSSKGMFIETPEPAPRATLLRVECLTGESGKTVRAVARVAWTREESSDDRPSGMGVKFVRLDARSSAALAQVLQTAPAKESAARVEPAHPAGADAGPQVDAAPEPAAGASAEATPEASATLQADATPQADPTPEANAGLQADTTPPAHASAQAEAAPRGQASPRADAEHGTATANMKPTAPARRSGNRGLIALVLIAAPVAAFLLLQGGTPDANDAAAPAPVIGESAQVASAVPAPEPAQEPTSAAPPEVGPGPANGAQQPVIADDELPPAEEPAVEAPTAPAAAPAASAPVVAADEGPAAPAVPAGAAEALPAEQHEATAPAAPAADDSVEAAAAADGYRLRVVTTPEGAQVTIGDQKRSAPFSVTLDRAELAQPLEVSAELAGHRPTKARVSANAFELVRGVARHTLYLKLRPREKRAVPGPSADGTDAPAP